jgi:DnaJ-class molecular chaperone
LDEVTQTFKNPYTVLGVPSSATADEIKSAYRKLALKYHPDRNPGDQTAEARFKEISEAYATLRDPNARARFDRYGATRPEASRPDFSTVDWQTVFQEADIPMNWDAHQGVPKTGNAVFDTLFGVMTGMMRNSGLLPGEHREVALEISLQEARAGTTRRVRVPGPSVCAQCRGTGLEGSVQCAPCGGRGVLRGGSQVEVSVPKGVRHGVKLRLQGLGGPGRPPGDAFVTVNIRTPAGTTLKGRDIHTDVSITPLEAGGGARLKVHGVPVTVPRGAKDGQQLRVAGAGLGGGDLVMTLNVRIWQGVGRKLRDALSDFVQRD